MANSVVLERLPAAARDHAHSLDSSHRRQRVYIFLTRYGFIFAINLVVMLLGAVNYNNSLAYALTFLLAGLFMVSMLHTYSNLRGLIISSSPAAPVFAGQVASFPLLLDNRSGPCRLAIDLLARPNAVKRKDASLTGPVNLPAHSLETVRMQVHTRKRGYLVPGRIRISSTWPIGLYRAWSYMHIEQGCVVYPNPAGTAALPPQTLLDEDEQTGAGSGTEDFTGFRQYRVGDSMRAVDWKAYARERGLVTKRFSGRGTRKLLLDWQYTDHIGETEDRLSQLCLWVLEADKLGAHYALALPGLADTGFDNGEAHKHRCLQALARYGLDDGDL